MSFSFSINAKGKPQSNRLKKPSDAAADSPSINYVSEFRSDEAPAAADSKIKPITPIPNAWRPNKKLKNLPNLPPISQSNGEDAAVQFELDPGSNPEPTDTSTGYGLNLRQPSGAAIDAPNGNYETISDMELRRLREDLGNLPDGPGLDEFEDVPVDGFGAALLSGYGWKEGRGIGRNAKEDVKIAEVTRKRDRGGLGFIDENPEPEKQINTNGNAGANHVNGNGRPEKMKGLKEKDTKGFVKDKEVVIVNGREMGMKGKILEVRNGGDLLVVRMSKSNDKVKVRSRDVVEVGSAGEEKCMRKLKELSVKESDMYSDKNDRNLERKNGQEKLKARSERINWLRTHIRVRIVSRELKGGRLFLKKGVVMDVVGPGVCDISVDESRELVQGVDQDLLETALPKRGGPVLVLCGRHKGVYGTLLERDSEKETGLVRDADTHELLNVKLEQVAEYTGDPSDIGY
ncbi:protein MOS2-like [Salvia miltiorrhiza]|uniref:protein MOS2-like n=1 Tax=Salvia miltiorrhiza TaxID=226208 RepID=UPI0025AC118C|nr:protein MOS2-like [Salvia miltiorrhiza]XP_057799126.1 protein MOS2-like [Salvia miltiorrhiza]XP_057799133.1 protein MOS2-like [Salvia miltiorrhiza]XP_057799134.1 protein MOS2-like [Salvia miltiorrhiza]